MKVTKVDAFLIGAGWWNFTFVKIQTDSGLVGWGEGTSGWKESAVRELVLDYGRRYVVGQNPFDIEDLWFRLYQIEHNTGPVMFSAMAGIEMALWDIVGKACGQPVFNLVGGKVRSKVKAYANGWYSEIQDLKHLADRASDVAGRDYPAPPAVHNGSQRWDTIGRSVRRCRRRTAGTLFGPTWKEAKTRRYNSRHV
jgi:galactonate dehydratase